MKKYYFTKYGTPVWIRVPGTPFGTAAFPETANRLPGMTEWAPNDVISRVGRSVRADVPLDEIEQQEMNSTLGSNLAKGGLIGGVGGGLAARVFGGEAVTKPFTEIGTHGLNKETFRGLKNIPRVGKIVPAAGLGAGLLGALYNWHKTKPNRKAQTQDVVKGLLTEQILQQHALNQASQYYDYPTAQSKTTAFTSSPSMMAGFSNMGG